MHAKLPQVISVEGLPAAPVVRDPYAVTRRRAAERKAAVDALMHDGAPVVRPPEVLPPEQMLARPSLLLERMGFKVRARTGFAIWRVDEHVGECLAARFCMPLRKAAR